MSDANNIDIVDLTEQTEKPDQTIEKNGEKRKRVVKLRSPVWEHFTKIVDKSGVSTECKCNCCKRTFSCSSNGGTTHLRRHIDLNKCPKYKKPNEDKSQTLLSYAKGGSNEASNVGAWKFSQETSRSDLTELIINRELPFNFVEDPSFRKYIWGINPKYKFLGRITIKSDCMKRYGVEKNILKEILQKSSAKVCLTTDTWTSHQDLPYLALTAHFVDDGWKLHKRIINFVMIPEKATGEYLSDVTIDCLCEWNITNVCTITIDNCSTNDVLARTLSKHYASRKLLLLQGQHIQVHCWAHVLNLIVQDGLDEIKDSIRRVRKAVKFVKASGRRKIEFLKYAKQECVPQGKMLVLDVCTRWNSTYLMLGSALHYRRAYDLMKSRDSNFKDPPTSEDWEKAEIGHHFLEAFYTVTTIFSGTKYCNSNLFFREVYRILVLLCETASDLNSLLGRMALDILVKFEKYWMEKDPNILLSIALILDSRYKQQYLKFCYTRIYDPILVASLMSRVNNVLRDLFDEYMLAYEACRCEEMVNKDKGNDDMAGSSISSLKKNVDFMEDFNKFNEEEDISQSKTELDTYLEEKLHPSKDGDNFDVLQWWKANSLKFPVLSRMARDILAIPVSSVASESAFSTGGRILSPFRSSLLPPTVEALVCTQDWIRGEPVQTYYDDEVDAAFGVLTILKDPDRA